MMPQRAAKSTLLIFSIIITSFLLVRGYSDEIIAAGSPDYKELRLFRNVMGIVQKDYVQEVTEKKLIQGALKGMLQSLDPYSEYLNADMFKELQAETTGEFGGLGIEISLQNETLTIVSPIEDTPAYQAGLKPGDKILKIDGETTKNITLLKAVTRMRGRPGTKVTLTIMREGSTELKDYTIERAIIHLHPVKSQSLEEGYPYVKITSFQESTETDLDTAIKNMGGDEKIRGMVLDLRNDPGGLLDQAWKVASLFLEKGELIVYTDSRTKNQQMEFRATGTGKHYKFKIAVLINEGSASASEIVTGALQDHDRALIFGTKSFGKASVQTIIPLAGETGLKLTTAYYYTPKGRHIQKTGIIPDVDMKEAVKKQQETEEKTKPQRLPRDTVDPKKDPVLAKALEWLKSDVTVTQFKSEKLKGGSGNTAMSTE